MLTFDTHRLKGSRSAKTGGEATFAAPDCCAAWRERVKALDAEYARLQKLIDDSFKSEKEPNANAGERIPLVVKLFEVKHRADDIEALLEGKMPPDERRSKRGTQHNAELSEQPREKP